MADTGEAAFPNVGSGIGGAFLRSGQETLRHDALVDGLAGWKEYLAEEGTLETEDAGLNCGELPLDPVAKDRPNRDLPLFERSLFVFGFREAHPRGIRVLAQPSRRVALGAGCYLNHPAAVLELDADRAGGDPDKSPTEKQALLRAFIEQKERDIQGLATRLGSSQGTATKTGRAPVSIGGYTIEQVD